MTLATPGALDGVRVLELGASVAAAFAARLLADLGADVVKVEPAAGDPLRAAAPFGRDRAGTPRSALFEYANWGKRGVVLEPAFPGTDGALRDLALRADIVLGALGALEEHGTSAAALRDAAPRLVVTTVSDFGAGGPLEDWQATDLVLYATSGMMQISGTADREPLKHGLRQSVWLGGLNAAYASLAAHLGARATGAGAHLDLSLREVLASELVVNEAYYAFGGAVQRRQPTVPDPFAGDPLRSKDGYVTIQTTPVLPIEQIVDLFDEPRLADERFSTSSGRVAHAAELRAILAEHLQHEPGREYFVRACSRGFLAGFVQGAGEMLGCPQLEARAAFRTLPGFGPDGADWKLPAQLAALSATPMTVRREAPALGEHTVAVLLEIMADPVPPTAAPAPAGEPVGPLAGLRVLDLSTVFAVPYMAGLLADMGAEVIKVEPPRRLDQTRSGWGLCFDNDPGDAYWDRAGTFHQLNRGKRSIGLDLSTAEGREVLRTLVAESDVLLDNFTPRVMRKWGTTYDDLREINPRLVMLSNTGYGSTGPWAAFKAQGTVLEATMGMTQFSGYPGEKPSKVGQSHPDFVACWAGLTALMAALVHRDATGEGQWIDLGMYQLAAFVMPEALVHVQAHGTEIPRRGNADLDAVLSGVFPALGDDRWLAVSVADEATLRRLVAVVGDSPSAEAALRAWASTRDAGAGAGELQRAGVPAGAVLDARDLLLDPTLRARGFYETATFDGVGRRPLIGRPYTWASPRTAVAIAGPAPSWGADTDAVLRDLAGLDATRIAALHAAGAVTRAPVDARPARPLDLARMLQSGVLSRVDEDYADVLDQEEVTA
jgi:crotonobetainyl-CoA:carnitine CoA-transferase CaiB-like acyl-CoA transferase